MDRPVCPKCKKTPATGIRVAVGKFRRATGEILKVPVGGALCDECFAARGIPAEVDLIPSQG